MAVEAGEDALRGGARESGMAIARGDGLARRARAHRGSPAASGGGGRQAEPARGAEDRLGARDERDDRSSGRPPGRRPRPRLSAPRAASTTRRAAAISASVGRNTAFASGTWVGWMQDLPMKPSRRAASASRVYPSGSLTVPVDRVARPHARPPPRPGARRAAWRGRPGRRPGRCRTARRDRRGRAAARRRADARSRSRRRAAGPRGDSMFARMPDRARDPAPASCRASAAAAARTSSADSGLGTLIMSTAGQATAATSASKCGVVKPFTRTMTTLPPGRGGVCRRKARSVRARLGLPALLDRVLQVEGDRVGLAREGLGEELGPRGGHEQLAAHEQIHRAQAPRVLRGPDTAPAPAQPLDLLARRSRARPGSRASAAPGAGAVNGAGAGPSPRAGPDAPCRGSVPTRGCSNVARMPSAATCGWSNMSSTGARRRAGHALAEAAPPTRARCAPAAPRGSAARSRPACCARFLTVSKRGSRASSGRPVSSHSAFQKCGVLAET